MRRHFVTQQTADTLYTSAILSGPICAMLGLDWKQVQIRAGFDLESAHTGSY